MRSQFVGIGKTTAVALLAVLLAAIVRTICHSLFNETIPYTPFYPAIVVATMYGRLRGGVIATILAAGAASFWLSPFGSPTIVEATDLIGLGLFVVVSALVVALCERMLSAHEAAEQHAEQRQAALVEAQTARRNAEDASRLKDVFLATVSHELRTPLQAILGWSEVLAVEASDNRQWQEGLHVIEQNARAQATLIEDLLDLGRITSGKLRLTPRPINPKSIIDAAVQTVKVGAEAKRIRIERDYRASCSLYADPDRLQQVVWNLLSNAVKFSSADSTITVRLEATESLATISVIDEGKGISPDFLPHIFDLFRQADASVSRSQTGLGIGLSLVKHIVELHGGSVHAASEGVGRGTSISVQMPCVSFERSPTAQAGGNAHRPQLSGVRVLVVDDDVQTCDIVRRVLEACNADVASVTDPEDAIGLAEEFAPDVIVSDIGMPECDGYEMLRRIRRRSGQAGGEVRAMALTAYSTDEDRLRCFDAGYQLHLAKPVDARALREAVAELALAGKPWPA
jgi:signal transduction histidine kinase/CheY-like chemotaxis protein